MIASEFETLISLVLQTEASEDKNISPLGFDFFHTIFLGATIKLSITSDTDAELWNQNLGGKIAGFWAESNHINPEKNVTKGFRIKMGIIKIVRT